MTFWVPPFNAEGPLDEFPAVNVAMPVDTTMTLCEVAVCPSLIVLLYVSLKTPVATLG